ncbi:hypothetical protein [Photorhabdus heterorhabditis]|nr:hypothetical protein [Photorhabdus heterorhabditis]
MAEKLDAPKGKLQKQMTDWLRYRLASGDDIGKLTSADYLQTLNEQ